MSSVFLELHLFRLEKAKDMLFPGDKSTCTHGASSILVEEGKRARVNVGQIWGELLARIIRKGIFEEGNGWVSPQGDTGGDTHRPKARVL